MFDGLRLTADLPPLWMLLFGAAAWGLGTYMPLYTYDLPLLGWILTLGGIALILWSAWFFWAKSTPIEPGVAPKALIQEGPYRLNRNPIYTGLVAILLGYAVGLGAVSALLPAVLFPVFLTGRFVVPEEAVLRETFGAEGAAWIEKTRRW